MKASEYRGLLEKERSEFRRINHNVVLKEMLRSSLPSILNFPKESVEFIRNYQLKKLRELVDYAYLNIPLYREKYGAVGYRVGDITKFEDFEKLPLLSKEELIEGFPTKIVKNVEDFKYSTRSSGSSGRFVTLALSLEAIYLDTLQGVRQFIRQSDFHYTKKDKVLYIYTCPWWIKNIEGDYQLDFLPTTTKPEDVLEYIKQTKPLVISTYPTFLQRLCSLKVKLSDFGVKYVIVHSEQSTSQMRHDMAELLGIKIYDEYSSEELTRIALECSNGCYHLEEDACYIEVMNPKTKEIIKNGIGIVVGTNLLNRATPIIRYCLGDIVKIESDKKCSCGHNGRILTEIQGREMDCIISGNDVIPASAFMDIAYNWFLTNKIPIHGIRYQIVQSEKKKICVYLMKDLYELTQEDTDKIKQSLYKLVDNQIEVTIKYTDKFIYTSNKFKPVINLIGATK